MIRTIGLMGAVTVLTAGLVASPAAVATGGARYEVTVTNLTLGQTLTPLLLATHRDKIQLFELGTPASPQLTKLAEQGDVSELEALLGSSNAVFDVVNAAAVLGPPPASLLGPGESVTHEIHARGRANLLSLAAMFVPTNDAFAALNGVRLPSGRRELTYYGLAYDAGSEVNDQLCTSIPAFCPPDPDAAATDTDENGVVHVHSGIHEIGDLSPADYDWRNPTIRVVIKRVR